MKDLRQGEPPTPIRVAFLINSMERGGAERVAHTLVEALTKDGQLDITLILLENKRTLAIPPTVRVVALLETLSSDATKLLTLPVAAVRLRRLARRQQIAVVLSSLERSNFVNVLSRVFGSPHRAVISEHTDPCAYYRGPTLKNWAARLLIRTLYTHADQVVAVSHGVLRCLVRSFGVPERKVGVIHDPCAVERAEQLAREDPRHPWFAAGVPVIITAGRLVPLKGHSHLLRAFAMVRQHQPCRLMLLGEGPSRGDLERLAVALEVENDVAFLGWQGNPYQYMSHATVFAFPSLWEGFGLALVEALACGLPVISYDCESGPREILQEGLCGVLVPVGDQARLAEEILKLLRNPAHRQELSIRARERAKDFDLVTIAEEYRRILTSGVG